MCVCDVCMYVCMYVCDVCMYVCCDCDAIKQKAILDVVVVVVVVWECLDPHLDVGLDSVDLDLDLDLDLVVV